MKATIEEKKTERMSRRHLDLPPGVDDGVGVERLVHARDGERQERHRDDRDERVGGRERRPALGLLERAPQAEVRAVDEEQEDDRGLARVPVPVRVPHDPREDRARDRGEDAEEEPEPGGRRPRRRRSRSGGSSGTRPNTRRRRRRPASTTQAMGTWKKTMREDSPTKFWAGRAYRKAPQQIAAIPRPRNHLAMKPRLFTAGIIPPGRRPPIGALASETPYQNRKVTPTSPRYCRAVSSFSCSPGQHQGERAGDVPDSRQAVPARRRPVHDREAPRVGQLEHGKRRRVVEGEVEARAEAPADREVPGVVARAARAVRPAVRGRTGRGPFRGRSSRSGRRASGSR